MFLRITSYSKSLCRLSDKHLKMLEYSSCKISYKDKVILCQLSFSDKAEFNDIHISCCASDALEASYGDEVEIIFERENLLINPIEYVSILGASSMDYSTREFIKKSLTHSDYIYVGRHLILQPEKKVFLMLNYQNIYVDSSNPFKITKLTKIFFHKSNSNMEKKAFDSNLNQIHKYKSNILSTITWDDIGGQKDTKLRLQECLKYNDTFLSFFKKLGLSKPKGVLLHGPPGCSKTLLAKAVCSEYKGSFFAIKGPEIFSKWVGESEKNISELFGQAKTRMPSVIFFVKFYMILG